MKAFRFFKSDNKDTVLVLEHIQSYTEKPFEIRVSMVGDPGNPHHFTFENEEEWHTSLGHLEEALKVETI